MAKVKKRMCSGRMIDGLRSLQPGCGGIRHKAHQREPGRRFPRVSAPKGKRIDVPAICAGG
jgi:hypothetical protein